MNKVILYIATSLDGFIADSQGRVDWLPHPKEDTELDTMGYQELMQRIDTILMGRRSYDQILGFGDWAWPDKHTFVFSSQGIESDKSYISVTEDEPRKFMTQFKTRKSSQDIWLLGGAELAKSFADVNLIDEIILTIIPQTLGDGIPLGLDLQNFELSKEKILMDGIIQRSFRRMIEA